MMQKSTRIKILLGVDTAFFLLEIIVGYAVHSLALVADSFHMVRPCVLFHGIVGMDDRCLTDSLAQ
jgi:Co/Zn/Cd efflux system component